jgi:hypothetical protein
MLLNLGLVKFCKICDKKATTADGKLQIAEKTCDHMREHQWNRKLNMNSVPKHTMDIKKVWAMEIAFRSKLP